MSDLPTEDDSSEWPDPADDPEEEPSHDPIPDHDA
jgi:hypothetical protein